VIFFTRTFYSEKFPDILLFVFLLKDCRNSRNFSCTWHNRGNWQLHYTPGRGKIVPCM